jgi:hypothetical protein
MDSGEATASDGHQIQSLGDGKFRVTSSRFPFCATGPTDSDDSIRSGMTLVPFGEDLNRFMLQASNLSDGRYQVTWGDATHQYTADELADGVNLADDFHQNPFCDAFERVDQAVAAKQAYETVQVKRVFHGRQGRRDFEQAVADTEAVRQPLADAIQSAMAPVTHEISIAPVP